VNPRVLFAALWVAATLSAAAALPVGPAAGAPLGAAPNAQPGASIPGAISSDPPRDAQRPAAMYELSIPSHGAMLYGVFYRASGAAPHPTAVLLHGLPGFEQNGDLAQAVRRAGWNALIFHYRGAWGSGGTFSFSHCLEDVRSVLEYLRVPATAARLGVDVRRLVLIGHSVGGQLAGMSAIRDSHVAAVAMISPASRHLARGAREDEATLARYRGELGPLSGATAEGLLAEQKQHAVQWDLVTLAPRWKPRPVLIVESDDIFRAEDEALAAAERAADPAHLTEIHLTTDHAYSDQRIALQVVLLSWLRQFGP
jgi:uncharacterized protein